MRKIVLLCLAILTSASMSFGQNRSVTGTVASVDGTPLSGVTIILKGTSVGSISGNDGRFSIMAPANSVLEFSYLGYEPKEVNIGQGGEDLFIVLESSATVLDNVVVTALGIKREAKALGYAAQNVNADLLGQANNSNFIGSLQGKVSGLQITPSSGMPGASSMMVIRGARSFTGDNTPLYVVDGMPINSGIDLTTGQSVTGSDYANRAIDIDPNDIESINVLKGQAASALYGMRASNGVIMITTRSGSSAKNKTVVTINTSVTFDQISRYPDLQTKYAQGAILNGVPTYIYNSSMAWGPEIKDLVNDSKWGYGGSSIPTDDPWSSSASSNKYYVPQRADAGVDPWVTPRVYDNMKAFFNTGVTFNNSVNVARTTDQGSFSITFSTLNQEGIVPNAFMDRYNAKISATTKLHKNWTAGFNGNFVSTKMNKYTGGNDGTLTALFNAPTSYDLAGIPTHIEGDEYVQTLFRSLVFDNPFWAVEHNSNTEDTDRFYGSAFVNFSPDFGTPDHTLNIKLQMGTDIYATAYQNVFGYGSNGSLGSISERTYKSRTFNGLLTADYNWIINSRLRLDVVAGAEINNSVDKYVRADGNNFNFSGWNHIENASVYNSYESTDRERSVGIFGQATLAWADQLYLTITGRADKISTMPRGARTYFYPSFSASYVLTEIEGLRNNDVLSFAKIRASVAQVGQPGTFIDPYYETPLYSGGFYNNLVPMAYPYNGMTAFVPSASRYDPNLKPQNTFSYEVGFDTYFFKNILGLSYTFSEQNVKNQIFAVPIAGSTGVAEMHKNAGHINTKSHEITLSVNVPFSRNFRWNTSFNFTKIDNVVKELADGVESIFLGGFVTPQVRASVGDKFPTLYGVTYQRNDDGVMVVDNEGMPIAGPSGVLGSASPDFILGMNTEFIYKNLSLGLVFDWKQGGEMYAGSNQMAGYYGVSEQSRIDRDNGIKYTAVDVNNNPVEVSLETIPQVQKYYSVIESIGESGINGTSYVKLREIVLAYNFNIKKKVNIGVNVFARNILLWSELPNYDPEMSQGNTNMAGAFERFSLPQTSSYGLGLSVKF